MKFNLIVEKLLLGNKPTIAIVPGSFKPPHKGHLDMISQYSKRADEVYVLISAPTKSQRTTATGSVISPIDAKKIFDIYLAAEGLDNVKVEISPSPSPITAAFDFIEKNLKDVNVALGSSKKDNDWQRWSRAQTYFKEKNPSITVLDPMSTAVEPYQSDDGIPLSASEFRASINSNVDKFLPDSVIANKKYKLMVLDILRQ